ncbi:hypothetical protein LOK49_LG08G00175 [Camellia lanceoleosa]|uniref:Uncharacterized protein n=1 Tax=Camellia lanceoleosa TaxID=1840588 RepID=A0ACC0GSA7_9ERIC|nr:hypothetical protein LOK49_LG08G00175 [Camellia lanceoleosa]
MEGTGTGTAEATDPSTSIFSQNNSRLPDDTVFYSIFPDFSSNNSQSPKNPTTTQLQSLHLQILHSLSPYTSDYIWQHEPFTLSLSTATSTCICSSQHQQQHQQLFPHLHGKVRFGDNLEDEWFVVFLLFQVSSTSLTFQFVSGTPMVRVPVSVAQVLKHEPCLISLAVEAFYDRDIDSMKYAAKMDKFLSNGSGEEIVQVSVRMSRAMYAQLVQQTFQAPKCYPMPPRSDTSVYVEAELGMKIACGFEMMYRLRQQREGLEGNGTAWEAFKESLERSGYFDGLLPGSKEYRRLMENAQEYYRNSSLYSKASEMMSAPVRRIDEILALPYSADDFRGQVLPSSDDDSWLYNGEDELNAALLERQKEMELYNSKHNGKQKSKEQQDSGPSFDKNSDDFGLGDIAKSMQAFVHKMSSYKGAEVPGNRNPEAVGFDVDRFMEDIKSVMGCQAPEDTRSNVDTGEGSSSDMDFDESEDESDMEPSENNEEEGDTFMRSYSDALNEELKTTTLDKSFVRAESVNKNEGTSNAKEAIDVHGKSNATEGMDEEFTPVDVDVNLVKSFLDSFSSQQGLPGPASNLLGLMGLHLPQDPNKDK